MTVHELHRHIIDTASEANITNARGSPQIIMFVNDTASSTSAAGRYHSFS